MKHDLMIFCTCAEHNAEMYLDRVRLWYKMLSPLHDEADFFCAVDGLLPDGPPAELAGKIQFIEHSPALGRKGTQWFPGWKRSYGKMLSFAEFAGYACCVHIENDVIIRNFGKLREYLRKPGLYSSWNEKYNFIEGAFQILNDPPAREKLGKFYSSPKGYDEPDLFENVLGAYPFEYPFTSCRIERDPDQELINTADLTAQSYYDERQNQWK